MSLEGEFHSCLFLFSVDFSKTIVGQDNQMAIVLVNPTLFPEILFVNLYFYCIFQGLKRHFIIAQKIKKCQSCFPLF